MIFTFTYLQAQFSFGFVNNFPAGKAKRKESTDYSDKGGEGMIAGYDEGTFSVKACEKTMETVD